MARLSSRRILDTYGKVINGNATFNICLITLSIAFFFKDLTAFKDIIDEYDSRTVGDNSDADTYKLIMLNSDGTEVVKTFSKSEYSDRAKLLYNEITNSIDEMGQSITEQEKRQILIEILEKLC